MTKEEHIKYWCDSAQHDMESSEIIFTSGRYDWCLFVGHLALEKILKAVFVDRNDNNMPPKIHILIQFWFSLAQKLLTVWKHAFLTRIGIILSRK